MNTKRLFLAIGLTFAGLVVVAGTDSGARADGVNQFCVAGTQTCTTLNLGCEQCDAQTACCKRCSVGATERLCNGQTVPLQHCVVATPIDCGLMELATCEPAEGTCSNWITSGQGCADVANCSMHSAGH